MMSLEDMQVDAKSLGSISLMRDAALMLPTLFQAVAVAEDSKTPLIPFQNIGLSRTPGELDGEKMV